jgi:hypothetical protein
MVRAIVSSKLAAVLIIMQAMWNMERSACAASVPDVPMTYVMYTDNNYIIPTLVTLFSLLRVNSGNYRVVVFDATEGATAKQWGTIATQLPSMIQSGAKVSIIPMIDKRVQLILTRANKPVVTKPHVVGELKILLPFLLKELLYESEEWEEMGDYIWLDSDMIIRQDLTKLYEVCRQRGVVEAAANFYATSGLRKASDDPTIMGQDDGKSIYWRGRKLTGSSVETEPQSDTMRWKNYERWRTSGGLVYVHAGFILRAYAGQLSSYTGGRTCQSYEDDEVAIDSILANALGETDGYALLELNPIFNLRPSLLPGELVHDERMAVDGQIGELDGTLRSVVVFHWDEKGHYDLGVKYKPWQQPDGIPRNVADQEWWLTFGALINQVPGMVELAVELNQEWLNSAIKRKGVRVTKS